MRPLISDLKTGGQVPLRSKLKISQYFGKSFFPKYKYKLSCTTSNKKREERSNLKVMIMHYLKIKKPISGPYKRK